MLIEIPLPVNTYDIDVAGHVNNIVYMRWLEDMRNQLFLQFCPLNKLLEKYYYPVIVACDMKYKKQVRLFDKPSGRMYLSSHSHGLFILKAEITVNGKTAFTATQRCVLLNLNDNTIYKGDISVFSGV